MALDVTGSMRDDGKMPAMQTAAKSLIDQLSPLAKNPGDIYISVVPFAKDVNLGTSYYNETWIDWSDWKAANRHYGNVQQHQLHDQEFLPKHQQDLDARPQQMDRLRHRPHAGLRHQEHAADFVQCADDGRCRGIRLRLRTKYCKTGNDPYMPPIMPLSYDWNALKTMIGTMQPTGNTNQGIGLAWGWLTLGTGAPFNAPAKDTANYTYKEAIILLSDGLNTQNRWYSNASQIDARQKILCDNAKAANITIYTIHVNTGNDPTSAVLKYCASGADKFFEVKQANQTLSVFNSIGQSLAKLRIAK